MTSTFVWGNETTTMSTSMSDFTLPDGDINLAWAMALAVGTNPEVGTEAETNQTMAFSEAEVFDPADDIISYDEAVTDINENPLIMND